MGEFLLRRPEYWTIAKFWDGWQVFFVGRRFRGEKFVCVSWRSRMVGVMWRKRILVVGIWWSRSGVRPNKYFLAGN